MIALIVNSRKASSNALCVTGFPKSATNIAVPPFLNEAIPVENEVWTPAASIKISTPNPVKFLFAEEYPYQFALKTCVAPTF